MSQSSFQTAMEFCLVMKETRLRSLKCRDSWQCTFHPFWQMCFWSDCISVHFIFLKTLLISVHFIGNTISTSHIEVLLSLCDHLCLSVQAQNNLIAGNLKNILLTLIPADICWPSCSARVSGYHLRFCRSCGCNQFNLTLKHCRFLHSVCLCATAAATLWPSIQ